MLRFKHFRGPRAPGVPCAAAVDPQRPAAAARRLRESLLEVDRRQKVGDDQQPSVERILPLACFQMQKPGPLPAAPGSCLDRAGRSYGYESAQYPPAAFTQFRWMR